MTDRTTARIVGALFIAASVAAVVGGTLILPAVDPGFLTQAPAQEGRIVTGALLEFLLALSVIGIAVTVYPVLERHSRSLAIGYVAVRALEGALILGTTLSALSILSLSRSDGSIGPGAASAQVVGDTLVAAREWGYLLGPMLMFSLSALVLYSVLYRAGLVPAWLSVWGLVGAVLLLARGVVEMYGRDVPVSVEALLTAPIGLNEMVLAVYLLTRGFDEGQPRDWRPES